MGMGNGEGYASRPARWLEEKEEDGRPEQHGVGAAVGPVGAAAGGGRVGGGLPEGGGEERRDHGTSPLSQGNPP